LRTPHSEFEGTKPSTGTCINRNTTFEPLSGQQNCDLWAGRGNGKKRKKGGRRKARNRYAPRVGAISQPICTKCGEFVDLTDEITPAKFGSKLFIGFSKPRGRKTHFPFRKKQTAYVTAPCATALACDQ